MAKISRAMVAGEGRNAGTRAACSKKAATAAEGARGAGGLLMRRMWGWSEPVKGQRGLCPLTPTGVAVPPRTPPSFKETGLGGARRTFAGGSPETFASANWGQTLGIIMHTGHQFGDSLDHDLAKLAKPG